MNENRLNLLKQLSYVHAYKCMMTSDWEVAVSSFETVSKLKNRITSGETDGVLNEMREYAEKEPTYNVK